VLGRKRVGREYQSRFIYPKCGIQTLIDHTAKDIRDKIIVNAPVQRLIRSNQQWQIIVDGSKRAEVDYVVSTMPLVQLLEMINVDGVEEKYSELRWNDTYFVAIGLNTGARFKMLEQSHWVFFKEDEVFYRITMMKNFSSGFADTLVAEITNKGAVTQMSQEDIVDCVVRDLLQMRIIDSRKSIEMTDIRLLEHTYPIPTVGATTLRKHISGKLFQQNLFLLGRSGNWDYINMDGVIQKVNEFWFNIDCARH
jgi:protoporphyrinogen oxidase